MCFLSMIWAVRETLGLGCTWCKELVDGVTSSEGTTFAPGKTRTTLPKKDLTTYQHFQKHTQPEIDKIIYELRKNWNRARVPTCFPHATAVPSSRSDGAEPCWRKMEVGWTWKQASISTWCGTSVEPWTSWDIMGPYLGCAPKIAKLVYNSNFTRTDGRYIYN